MIHITETLLQDKYTSFQTEINPTFLPFRRRIYIEFIDLTEQLVYHNIIRYNLPIHSIKMHLVGAYTN